MKLIFWTVLIGATIWWLMKKNLGSGNDLISHLKEQRDLQQLGNTTTSANQIATQDNTLATIGQTPLAGTWLDPFVIDSPFSVPQNVQLNMSNPTNQENGLDFSSLFN